MESEDGLHDWQLLSAAEAPVARYRDAMADGLLALQALIDDLDTGPQTVGEVQASEEASGSSAPVPPRRGGAFGFGPLR
ncbi:MAG: hypothetical protein EOP81_13990 [Variovorax sp.]|nr:MAG: hypothetical protein EOP81_13990 [Variovorax sp.]